MVLDYKYFVFSAFIREKNVRTSDKYGKTEVEVIVEFINTRARVSVYIGTTNSE